MKRSDVLLAALAAAQHRPFYPVHLQKAMFIVGKDLPGLFDTPYDFQPYDYGPFDRQVYADADALKGAGLITIGQEPGNWYRTYQVTDQGRERGGQLLATMDGPTAEHFRRISEVVSEMSFRDLVSAVYAAYPEMKVNSVFKERA